MTSGTRGCLFLFTAFWLSRCALIAIAPHALVSSDSREYLLLAQSLAERFEFARASAPETFRTPGYSLFLALFHWLGVFHLKIIAVVQAALSAFASVMLFELARRLFNARAAWIAWLLYWLNPGSAVLSLSLLSETLFVFILISSLWFLHEALQQGSRWRYVALGFLLGALTLVRPIAVWLFLPAVFCLWLSHSSRRAALRRAALMLLGVALLQGGWLARNAAHYGEWYVSELPAALLYVYWAQAASTPAGDTVDERVENAWSEWNQASQTLTPPAMRREFTRHAIEILWARPLSTAAVFAHGFARLWIDSGSTRLLEALNAPTPMSLTSILAALRFEQGASGLIWAIGGLTARLFELMMTLLTLIAASISVPRLLRSSHTERARFAFLAFAALALIYLVILSSGPMSNFRFREQALPLLILFAAPELARWVNPMRNMKPETMNPPAPST
ncbi:MAG: hypothetical protein GC154_05870 [bacterium]|nr:hypothetical protein [bacterium]